MPPLTQTTWTNRVLNEVGAAMPSPDAPTAAILASLSTQIGALYQMALVAVGGGVNGPAVYLAYLYTKLAALYYIQGCLWPKTDARLGRVLMVSSHQKFANVTAMIAAVEKEIPKWEARVKGVRPPLVARLLQTSPGAVGIPSQAPDPSQPVKEHVPGDPSFPGLAGDPRFPGPEGYPGGAGGGPDEFPYG